MRSIGPESRDSGSGPPDHPGMTRAATLMIPPSLPSALRTALDEKLEGLPLQDLTARAASISKTYRDGGNSRTIATETDALAYAIVRMPAITASVNALCEIRPDFSPTSLLDVGAGPGTASWTAAEAFSSLQKFMLLDINAALQRLALDLARDHPRLGAMTCRRDVGALDEAEPADLVVASYLIGEIRETERG